MEENKTKTVEMKTEKKKFSYEELNDIASQLSQQNQQLYAQLQRVNMTNAFRRLDYLFKVVENGALFTPEFLDNCVSEIEESLTIKEEDTEDNKDSEAEN